MIYLDHAAATPMSKKARLAMERYFDEQFWNPSAPYLPAQNLRDTYENAKDVIAHAIGGKGADLVMTATATESINLAFTCLGRVPRGEKCVVISAVEHPAVAAVAGRVGGCDIALVDKYGVVDLDDLRRKITPRSRLVSVALASSELGSIQPVGKIAEIVKAERTRRLNAGENTPLYLHSDASQALSLLDVKVARLGVDLLTINAAKIYGPKGIAGLWVRLGITLSPLIVGGGQESGLRSGTENVPAVIGFASAIAEVADGLGAEQKRLSRLKNILKTELAKNPEIIFLGDPKHQLASHLPISIPGIDAERLIYKLEEREVYVSTGAACAANKHEVSPALLAIGLSHEQVVGSLRLTLGKLNTEENVVEAGKMILRAIAEEQGRGV